MITLTNGVQIPENAVQLQTTAAIDGYYVTQPLRLVQYDETLPVAAVQLTYQSQPYIPPTGAELNVRMGKPDGTTVYNPCLGVDANGVVYFAFTLQMTIVAGTGTLTVEITDSGVKNSAPIIAEIRPNPVPEGAIASTDEFLTLQEILAEAEKWGQIVQANADNIQQVVDNLTDIQNAAENAQAAAASAAAAQQAAQEALGFRKFYSAVVPDANGNLDPSRPMTVGPAASVEIESAGDRIQSVTALGFTQQAGTGDPSPTNVRQLTNGGLKLAKITLDGNRNWQKSPSPVADSFFFADAIFAKDALIVCDGYENRTDKAVPSVYVDAFQQFIITPTAFGQTTLEQWKERLNQNPLTVHYQPSNLQTAALYAPVYIAGGEYRATCLPLTAPLCEGDSVVSWAKSGCDKVVTFDGSEDEGWVLEPISIGGNRYYIQLENAAQADTATGRAIANWLRLGFQGETDDTGVTFAFTITATGRLYVRTENESLEDFKARLAAHPLTVWYRSTNYTEAADIPVSLETHQQAALVLDGTEAGLTFEATGNQTEPVLQIPLSTINRTVVPKCSHYNPKNAGFPMPDNTLYYASMYFGNKIAIRDSSWDSLGDAEAYLAAQYAAGTPVTIVYELATPITYAHEAVVLEAATGDQLTYTVTGQSGGTVSVALKPFQDGGHAATADNATSAQNADNATQFDGHTWDEVPGQAPVQSVNGKTGALTLSAKDVGAVPVGSRKVLANGIAWKSGSILTPDGWDDYSMIRISTNFGSAFIPKLAVNESSGNILVASALPNNYMNIAGFSIARSSGGASLSFDMTPYALRLAPSGVTALPTELSVYKIEGLV